MTIHSSDLYVIIQNIRRELIMILKWPCDQELRDTQQQHRDEVRKLEKMNKSMERDLIKALKALAKAKKAGQDPRSERLLRIVCEQVRAASPASRRNSSSKSIVFSYSTKYKVGVGRTGWVGEDVICEVVWYCRCARSTVLTTLRVWRWTRASPRPRRH